MTECEYFNHVANNLAARSKPDIHRTCSPYLHWMCRVENFIVMFSFLSYHKDSELKAFI